MSCGFTRPRRAWEAGVVFPRASVRRIPSSWTFTSASRLSVSISGWNTLRGLLPLTCPPPHLCPLPPWGKVGGGLGQVTGHAVGGGQFAKLGLYLPANGLDQGAAGVEPAARRNVHGARRLADQHRRIPVSPRPRPAIYGRL